MNLTGRPISIALAILLAGCVCLAVWQMFGMMFGMGESGEPASFLADAFLIFTALGILLLAVAALGSWSRHPFFPLAALVGCVGVLPMAAIFFKQSMGPTVWQYNDSWVAGSGILFFALDIAMVWLSWLRWRQLVRMISAPATPSQG